MNDHTSSVRLKGIGNTLCLLIAPEPPLKDIQAELTRRLTDIRSQIQNARLLLDTGEEPEEMRNDASRFAALSAFLMTEFQAAAVAPPPARSEETASGWVRNPEEKDRRQDMHQAFQRHHGDAMVLAGRVRSGQKIASEGHLIIMGDVNPGAEIMAGGDVLVMGRLMGTAIAGQPDDDSRIILALDFRPMQIQIGPAVAAGAAAGPGSGKDGNGVEFAHVEDGAIVVEPYLETDPFGRLPWPQAR